MMNDVDPPEFLDFDAALNVALREPGTEILGLEFVEPFTSLGAYIISVDADEPDYVRIGYAGGMLFSSCGEEDFFDLEDVPKVAKTIFYARTSELGDGSLEIYEMMGEYVLRQVLPGLDDSVHHDNAQFRIEAGAKFRTYWRQT